MCLANGIRGKFHSLNGNCVPMAAPIAVSSDELDELLKSSDNLFGFEVSDNLLEQVESDTIDVLQKDGSVKAIKKYSRVPNCAGSKYSFLIYMGFALFR